MANFFDQLLNVDGRRLKQIEKKIKPVLALAERSALPLPDAKSSWNLPSVFPKSFPLQTSSRSVRDILIS